MNNFKRVVELFKKAERAKKKFLKNFEHWKKLREKNTEKLKEIAQGIRTDKFNGSIAKVVLGSVGIVGGILVGVSILCPPLAAVTVPLAIGGGVTSVLGGGVVVGTTSTELVLLKNKLEDAKALIAEEEENFSSMKPWFVHSEELMKAMEELVGKDMLKGLIDDVKILFELEKLNDTENLSKKFMSTMEGIVSKMCKSCSQIVTKFGSDLAPVIISVLVVLCVVSKKTHIVLDCALMTHCLALGFASTADIGIGTGRLIAGMAMNGTTTVARVLPGTIGRAVALGAFVALGAALDVVNVVLSSIEIHNGAQSSQADEIDRVAQLLEEEYSFLLGVHDEIRKY
ncbi:uncharacterized protein TNIN_348581 [Trichonephila inaurata madagascariensis]|uniref:Apolipoprotein L3 n=1 Tax=Trichonephila inaurata madagascariensis TaxID=2747483 RepID=A0A8X6XZH3_9ARAC|nr:uncharacterized protein TNIN_348581 [Trichonephila inaurata madagascariensis]